MSAPAQPILEHNSRESPAAGFRARALHLVKILLGMVVAIPVALVFGLLRAIRWVARPALVAFAGRLSRSPLPARLLALGGMLSALTLALATLGLVGATAWDARIGVLLGGGAALMALPKWLGWPDRTLGAVVVLVLATGLTSRLLVATTLPAGTAWVLHAADIWLLLLLGSCVLVFLRGRTTVFGMLASGLGGLLLVSLGAQCLGVAVMAWADLPEGTRGDLLGVLLAACAVWIAAFLLSRLEASRPYRLAGRLLALRSLLLRLGGVIAGVAAGLSTVPAASDAAWTAGFGTPLEGLAPAIGYVVGALTGLGMAAIFAVLPRLLARLQLSGRLAASAAGETGWFAALSFQLPYLALFMAGFETGLLAKRMLPYIVASAVAALAHTAIRVLLGQVPKSSATPLWLCLPENIPAPASLDCALRAAREWSIGPVTVVAPGPAALKVRGAHLRLAQQAGLLPALFVDRPAQAANWQLMRLPPDLGWRGLPFCELYGGAAAWQAALAGTDANARVLVIVGTSTLGWDTAFFKALPAGSELLCQQADGVPPTDAGVLRDSADFTQTSTRSDWLARFRARNAPVSRPSRRVLVLHREGDALLAQRVANALDGKIDPAGRQVVASTLDARPSVGLLLRMDGRTWESVLGFAARFAASRGEAPGASFLGRLTGLVATLVASVSNVQLDLVALESAEGSADEPSIARGLESDADSVISLLPADAEAGFPKTYATEAYTGTLRLPPPSAQDEPGVAEVARRLLAGEFGAVPRSAELPSRIDSIHPAPVQERARGVMAENWTDLAPPPAPLAQGKSWHVFVSYRSLNRPWVLALYDILNGLGYKVFLDQYVLTSAAPLAVSLGDALDASQSAILVWSGKYEDSEWCKEEFAKLEVMQIAKKGFRYVIGRVDESEITGLAAAKLWVDFSKQPEGPGGSGLLSLLYGLQGQPLPPAAVKLAAKVDEQMRDGLLSVKACREAGDADALVTLTATDDMAWTGSPMLLCAAAEGLIAMKKVPEALQVLDRAEQAFPKAVRPKQLRGLALARSGETMKAQFVLGKLYEAGEIGPETLGILARTWMDRYNQTGERTFLLKSRDLYRQAFEAFPSDYYTGINAASKSLLAGEKEAAAQLAKRVQDLVGNEPVPGDYWKSATVAEVQLLQGKFEVAARLYKAAVLAAPLDYGSHDYSCRQAKLLLVALAATDEQKAQIEAAFPPAKKESPYG